MEIFLFGFDNMGELRISIPRQTCDLGFLYLVCKKILVDRRAMVKVRRTPDGIGKCKRQLKRHAGYTLDGNKDAGKDGVRNKPT